MPDERTAGLEHEARPGQRARVPHQLDGIRHRSRKLAQWRDRFVLDVADGEAAPDVDDLRSPAQLVPAARGEGRQLLDRLLMGGDIREL